MSKFKILTLILVLIYAIYMVWFAGLYLTRTFDSLSNILTNTYGVIIPLIGGIYGLFLSRHWSGFKSAIGKALFFLSLGLITYSVGMAAWLYYNLALGVVVPYPSFADAGFILSYPLWTIGAIFLSFATGANQGIKNLKEKTFLIIIPIIAIVFSYYFLVVIARQGVISAYDDYFKIFFDLAYPIGDVVILSISALLFGLSYEYLGGRYKKAIYFILAAFIANYIADFLFAYMTTLGTYYNGSIADVLIATFMTLLSIGIAGFALPDYKNKNFSIITINNANTPTVFHQIIMRIIKKQESIIGLPAWYEANNVSGFTVDRDQFLVNFFGDGKDAVDRLVTHYDKIFGKASRSICKEAIQDLLHRIPKDQIPSTLL